MQLDVLIFPTDQSIDMLTLAPAVEERGFGGLWVTEHTHIPTGRRTPWPGGGDLPEMYKRTLDPFVALTAAAAVTTTLRVGTGISLVAQHHPITLAKTVASLDLVSGGRLDLGIGVGWNVDEMEHHGVDPSRRRSVAREHVLAMKGLWANDAFGYDGEFVQFAESWSWPKPVQRPNPPVIMGGAGGPITYRHIAEYCDGWMPIHGRAPITNQLADLHAAAHAIGRDPNTIEIGIFGCPPKPEIIDAYEAAGVKRVSFSLPSENADVVLPLLDRYAGLIER